MLEPRRLTILWAFTARYRDSFTFTCIIRRNRVLNVGFEVFTSVVMKSTLFWDITPSSALKVNRSFGRILSSPSSGSNTEPIKKPECSRYQAELLSYSSTLKMETTFAFETSVDYMKLYLRRDTFLRIGNVFYPQLIYVMNIIIIIAIIIRFL
jgi:hypothetical protein